MLGSIHRSAAGDKNLRRLVSLLACAAVVGACASTTSKAEPEGAGNAAGESSTGGTSSTAAGAGSSHAGAAGDSSGAAAAGMEGEGGEPAVLPAFPKVYEGVAVPETNVACFGASNGSATDQLPAAYVLSADDALVEATGELLYYATNTTNLSALASDDDNLYLCHGAVVKIPKDGTEPSILARDDCGWGITQADDRVIWIGDAGPSGGQAIRSISKVGGEVSTLATATNAMAITSHGANIWWTENVLPAGGGTPTGIVATSTVAGVPKVAVSEGAGDLVRVVADTRSLVWLSYGAVMPRPLVYRYDRTVGSAEKWFDGAGTDSAGLGFDGLGIYVASYLAGGAKVIRLDAFSNGSTLELASVALGSGSWSSAAKPSLSRAMTSNGLWVWVASGAQPGFAASIHAMRIEPGPPTLAATCASFVTDILSDPSGVFAVTSDPTSVWVLPREPG
jgi:hypothetical protein